MMRRDKSNRMRKEAGTLRFRCQPFALGEHLKVQAEGGMIVGRLRSDRV
jgi:hypothetical protein